MMRSPENTLSTRNPKRWVTHIAWFCILCTRCKAGDVCGVVTDLFGQPLAGANVQAVDGSQRAVTDKEGRYCLRNLPWGSVLLSVALRGFHERRAPMPVPEGVNAHADIALAAGRVADLPQMSIRGVIADGNGRPLGGRKDYRQQLF